MRKKLISFGLGIGVLILALSISGVAGAFLFKKELKIGYFDSARLQEELPIFQAFEERVKEKQRELELFRGKLYKTQQDDSKSLLKNLLSEKDGKTPEEQVTIDRRYQAVIREKADDLNNKITRKQMEIETFKKVEMQALNDRLETLVEEAAGKKKMTVVVEKSVVLFGGTDITQAVLDQAKKGAASPEKTPTPESTVLP